MGGNGWNKILPKFVFFPFLPFFYIRGFVFGTLLKYLRIAFAHSTLILVSDRFKLILVAMLF